MGYTKSDADITNNFEFKEHNNVKRPYKMGSTQDLQILLAKRDARIRELEIENMELKSKLDKYQSIFPSSPPSAPGKDYFLTSQNHLRHLDRDRCKKVDIQNNFPIL